ncbi:MAG TPA: DNA polymerase III subunit epsilon [Hydrogenophaga sp.]|uniref:3'-5' exonuclease n=1 Tax=Hydrogenophaga TaxID=47420 RepID=UPI0008AD8E59|nr:MULTISPECIES: exonuclease domain-containing protein [Hydrogenophaga]MBU4180720.1 DNA polymerase III subunit epsilon [Gammaproteobacteria bacterium]OGA79401.1 MAG: DNA polymerase III subunit epsilon [Burkholderiales bacterium GWE1_65_30]OGA92943.1 MAG: DNA polymerase III subunit epsilon [Burkholderiales bacterium GWF1_66_17]MBU4283190.1 DNA polymerase III subunit epsilon [Gammaproteobacteria bacterium]MBU4325287.1 DNA polymerase III subunit epsilon [Gammaproteobacteria bacterium]
MSGQQKTDRRLWWLLVVAAVVSVAWLLATFGLLGSTLEPDDRATIWGLLGDRLMLISLTWGAGMAAIAWGLKRWFDHWVTPSVQLAEEAQVLLRTDVVRELTPKGNVETKVLVGLFNQLVGQREDLRREMDAKVHEAAQGIEQEKSRLAALMSELTQSVVVCNLDGRIILYNNRARMQFRALSQAPGVAGGAELIGLGRSIYSVFDRKLVAHALENIQQRMLRGAGQPSAQFVTTTAAGQLLRVQMAPVRSAQAQAAESPADRIELSGFVLMLDNITRDYEAESAKDQVLHSLTEGSRSALANMQAAIDMLDYPDLEPAMRERFLGVIREETRTLSQRIGALEAGSADSLKTRWPLEDMLGADLVNAALRRIEVVTGLPASTVDVDSALWLKVESFSMLQALVYLTGRLADEFEVRFVQLRLAPATGSPGKAQLDLIWSGQAMSTETVMSWEMDPMKVGHETTRLTVRDVVERHGGAFWFERERVRHQAFFRFLLPLANPQEQVDAATFLKSESRPEYYDFDLFKTTEQTRSLDDRKLADLVYTVFDTETTGLNPSQGDEIIQIGAARIVNNKLLRQECFEQLVDPKRPIPAASIPIHGIQPEMVVGQPTIDQVLPAFHAFAQDTVLVAHNAAFDMRFLQLKEAQTGVVFDHPVLDTLLLSALIHPNQDSHRLEALAERFNVTVIGRHTALGDAMVTAEVFVKLIPMLAEKGIHTLGEAREAAQKTYYARIKY